MNETLQRAFFVTHSETGSCDPNGFFCPDCFMEQVEKTVGGFNTIMSYSEINPEDSPYYECNTCRKDYRD